MHHLFRFHHGLGDAVQLTVVLRHLAELRPDWTIDVQTRLGAESLFAGLVRCAFSDDAPLDLEAYDSVQDLAWPEAWQCYADSPSTKAERSLREVFGLNPVERLCRYGIQSSPDASERVVEYLERVCGSQSLRFNVALIHYQGNSARSRKNLDERIVAGLVRRLVELGVQPLLLDWDRRSELTAAGRVFNAASDERLWRGRTIGDGGTLAALIARVRLFIGIDSGPGHIAGATDTPSIIVWRRHHPLHFYGLSPNVTHLVPEDHTQYLRGDPETGQHYFARHYQHRICRELAQSLPLLAEELLTDADCSNSKSQIQDAHALPGGSASDRRLAPCRSVAGECAASHARDGQSLTLDLDHWLRPEHRAADAAVVREVYLDDCYHLGELTCRPRTILDVGAHIGSFVRRAQQRFPQARIVCVEANPANLAALAANVCGAAEVVAAACTYETSAQRLLSSVFAGSPNTGASRLTPADNWSWDRNTYRDAGDVPTVTLE